MQLQSPSTFFDRALTYLKESEAFKTKDLVKILKSARESEFSSRSHYVYYKRYLLPKFSKLGKRYKVGEEYHYLERRKVTKEMWFDLNVKVSENYVLFEFILNRNHEDFLEYYRYLLGKDRGKVFINKVRQSWREQNRELVSSERLGESVICVFKFEDSDVRRTLGYTQDSEDEVAFVADEGDFRVQGEIVLRAVKTDIEAFFAGNAESLKYQAVRYTNYLFVDCLVQVLVDMGFSPTIERYERWTPSRGHVVVEGALRRERAGIEALALAYGLARELRKRNLGKVIFSAEAREIWMDSERYGEYRVRVNVGVGRYGEKYLPAILEVEINRAGEVYKELCEDIDKQVRSLERQAYEYTIGNHFITLKNVLSTFVTYAPCIRPKVLEERALSTSARFFYVDQHSEVTITHKEHGETKVKFLRPFLIDVVTTEVDEDYPRELNRVALGLLKDEEFEELAKGLTGEERAWEW